MWIVEVFDNDKLLGTKVTKCLGNAKMVAYFQWGLLSIENTSKKNVLWTSLLLKGISIACKSTVKACEIRIPSKLRYVRDARST